MFRRRTGRGDYLRPFLTLMEGKPVGYAELVAAGRKMAQQFICQGCSVILCEDGTRAGVWDLERLTDAEAMDWGFWLASKAHQSW
jgi:hypothetical protein